MSKGTVVANHLEALGHFPVTRSDLAAAAKLAGVVSRLYITAAGAILEICGMEMPRNSVRFPDLDKATASCT